MSNQRRKRAAADDLYKQCKLGADCIPDVQNKYEQKTWADILLKIFGSIVYFGGLGIGSGRGSGGSLGYRPLGGQGGTQSKPLPNIPLRPSVVIDPIGPTDIVPIDPSSSSIVPLAEGTPDISFVAPDSGPGRGIEEIELYTIKDSTDIAASSPTIISSEETTFAVIDSSAAAVQPTQVFYDPPAALPYDINVFPAPPATTADINVFVDNSFTEQIVGGFDEIPLQRIDLQDFEIEETPTTSTPTQRLESAINRTKALYNRYIKQVPVQSADFLKQPSRLVQFEFDNPAFDADVTLEFQRDLAEVTAAPDFEFRDVIKLHRPEFGRTAEGTVRVSRLGETGTITTRSGTIIGQRVHFYYDVSNIDSAESIPLEVIGEHSNTSTIVDSLLSGRPVEVNNIADVNFTEDDLEDTYLEDFNNAHLLLNYTNEDNATFVIPSIPPGTSLKVFVDDFGNGIFVNYPTDGSHSIIITLPDELPVTPAYYLDSFNDFNLHPSLIPKKRRRLEMF